MITEKRFNELMGRYKTGNLSEKEKEELQPYKVDNAIIMAAGLASRFAPLSFEKPKGLLNVKGEILIERQIRQLQEVGIDDITIVVGYMKELFYYLRSKFNVELIVNDDYYRYNNTSTLIRVTHKLKNTYICSSDNYFTSNVFEPYVYKAYYSAVFMKGETEEWCIETDYDGLIINVSPSGGHDSWAMLGHVFFSKDFSIRFKEILEKSYEDKETRLNLWEKLYTKNITDLPMYIRKYEDGVIKEFDSLEELREFDENYINNTGSTIFANIRSKLNCEDKDITNIKTIKEGLTNLSFHFDCKGRKYIYRHPGAGTEKYINRYSEAFSMEVAKELGLDSTFIFIDRDKGWKISEYKENIHTLDYHNIDEVKKALTLVKRLHDANIKSKYDFGIWRATLEFFNKTKSYVGEKLKKNISFYTDYYDLKDKLNKVYLLAESDGIEKKLCHCDCYNPNFIISPDGEINLTDWEYSGNDDPAQDLGTFICCSDSSYEEAINIFNLYYGRIPSKEELRHNIAYVAIASYYWFVWAVFQNSVGNDVGEYLKLWYKHSHEYADKALQLYSN